MSLTSELKRPNSATRLFLEEAFPRTREFLREKDKNRTLRMVDTIRPVLPASYNTIGMAFDYRLRYFFAHTPWNKLVAAGGVVRAVSSGKFENGFSHSFSSALDGDLRRLRPVQRRLSGKHEQILARYCYALAWFEELARAPADTSPLWSLPSTAGVKDVLRLVPHQAVTDLVRLSSLAYTKWEGMFQRRARLNPTFEGSGDVGDADGDLIVGDYLWDVKTTVSPKLGKRWLYQILGYVLLDYSDRYRLRGVGFYLSRQGIFLKWRIGEILSSLSGGRYTEAALPQLRQRFHRELILRRLQGGGPPPAGTSRRRRGGRGLG